jgi:hypothetical protein
VDGTPAVQGADAPRVTAIAPAPATVSVLGEADEDGAPAVPATIVAAIALCVGVTVLFGLWPAPLVDFAHKATLLFR